MPESDPPAARLHPRVLLVAGLLLVPLFLPRIHPPEGRVWEAGWDALHFPGFMLITWTIALFLQPWARSPHTPIIAAALLALMIGGVSELIHDAIGRSSSWSDFAVDTVGVAFGVAGWYLLRGGGTIGRLLFGGLVIVALALLILPAIMSTRQVQELRKRFPDLGCFQDRASRFVWTAQGNATASFDWEKGALHVRVGPGGYSGVSCWPAESDWTGHSELRVGIENPGEPFALGIRIDDLRSASSRHGSRYNGERQVAAGTSEIRLSLDEVRQAPEGRQLDLAHIRRLVLFTGDESVGREFVINSAFLN